LDDDVVVGLLVAALDAETADEAVFTAAILALMHDAVQFHIRQLGDQSV